MRELCAILFDNMSSPTKFQDNETMQTQHVKHSHLRTTEHAQKRIAKRGVCPAALELLHIHGIDSPAGSGCVRREIRHTQTTDLSEQGYAIEVIDRALRLEAIFCRNERLVTCYQRRPQRTSSVRRQARALRNSQTLRA